MNTVPGWFERKFEFTFPAELHPNLCVRLLGTPARLGEMLSGISHASLTAKPEGKWSVQEHAGHLADMEPLWMARLHDFVGTGSTLTAADLSNRRTHEADHNAHELKTILGAFRASRLELIEQLRQLDPAGFTRALVHPRLQQPMRLIDHLYFVAEHDDHHLAAIWQMTGQ